jgi:hypothetical protein
MGDYCPSLVSFKFLNLVIAQTKAHKAYFRILTPFSEVKYLAFDGGVHKLDYGGLRIGFDTVPDGDWNIGYLTLDGSSCKFILNSTEKISIPGIANKWAPSVDERDLGAQSSARGEIQSFGKPFCTVYNNHFGFDKVMVEVEHHPEVLYHLVHDSEIYRVLDGHNITPKFIAHVTENNNRVIGFMIEAVSCRQANIGDLPACREVLSKLHKLGYIHGWLQPSSFLVCDDGRTLLETLGAARKMDETYEPVQKAFVQEMKRLEYLLRGDFTPPWEIASSPPFEETEEEKAVEDRVAELSKLSF